jgi:membrane protein
VLILLIWVYYSGQIFLLGAEFTRAYAERFGSWKNRRDKPWGEAPQIHEPSQAARHQDR